jgi:hypothetical protein
MNARIPCAASVAELDHDRPSASAPYWSRALDEIVDCLIDYGQFPKEGHASVKRVELLPEDFIYRAFDDLMLQDRKDGLWAEQARIKDSAEVYIRPKLEEPEYSWIVAGLAEDMARNAEADRDDE